MTHHDTQSHRNRKPQPIGKTFDISILQHVLDDPSTTSIIEVECGARLFVHRGVETITKSLWIGSYPDRRIPFSVTVADSKGEYKRAGSILTKGNVRGRGEYLGYASIVVDVGDIIAVAARTTEGTSVILLRINLFTPAEDNSCKAICDVLAVYTFSYDEEERIYTHEAGTRHLCKVNEHTLQTLLETARDNSIYQADWYQYHLSHLTAVPRNYRNKVDFTTGYRSHRDAFITVEEFYERLLNASKEFHHQLRNETPKGEPIPKQFFHRTPLKVSYTVENDHVLMKVSVPYCEDINYAITEENFYDLINEAFLLLYNADYGSLVDRIRTQSRGGDTITEERTFRM